MKNYIQKGDVLDVLLAADTLSGDTVVVGMLVGIAQTDGKSGETIAVLLVGVVEVAKTTGQSWALGAKLYFDSTTSKYTTTVGTNTLVGNVALAAASADTVGRVRLSN